MALSTMHPLAVRILETALDGTKFASSERAAAWDEPLGNVSYHTRTLVARGLDAILRNWSYLDWPPRSFFRAHGGAWMLRIATSDTLTALKRRHGLNESSSSRFTGDEERQVRAALRQVGVDKRPHEAWPVWSKLGRALGDDIGRLYWRTGGEHRWSRELAPKDA